METLLENARRVLVSPAPTNHQLRQATLIVMSWPFWTSRQKVAAEKHWTYVY